jgi:hypothetical protein
MPRRRSVDAGKISRLVSRPGVDPRTWITLARVVQTGFDPDHGFFADVEFEPTGEEQTCLIGAAYAGDGFGFFMPPKPDDIVVVAVPYGDQDSGPVIISRVWTGADKPMSDGGTGNEATEDVLLYVEPGKNLRVRATGGGGITMTTEGDGDIRLQAKGGGKVKLGDTALQPAVLGNTLYDWMQTVENRFTTLGAQASTLLAAYNAHTHTVAAAPGTTATPIPPASPSPPTPPIPPDPRATDTEVK